VKLEYTCEYQESEVCEAVLARHIATHGNPPNGYHWECRTRYDGYRVMAVEDATEKAAVPNE
jgi:hypothetical protein